MVLPNQRHRNDTSKAQSRKITTAHRRHYPKGTSHKNHTCEIRPNSTSTMPEPLKPRKRPPSPQNHKIFDAWNSASTGHQRHRAGYAGSSGWRDTRMLKLERQFRDGDCLREEDSAPTARARAFDGICVSECDDGPAEKEIEKDKENVTVNGTGEWRWVSDAEAKRSHMGVRDIRSFMGVSKRKADDSVALVDGKKQKVIEDSAQRPTVKLSSALEGSSDRVFSRSSSSETAAKPEGSPKIFAGMTVFINGSTLPLISDHKLKQLLIQHGAQVSIFMARKSVSHMIVGQPNAGAEAGGAGGGLSARKLQQEIARGGWKGVKITNVEWYGCSNWSACIPGYLY